MQPLEIYIPGKAVPQGRPRFARIGAGVRTYDAKQSVDYKSWVKHCAIEVMKKQGAGIIPRDIPLHMILNVVIARPKSAPKKRLCPVVKPDLDNIQKTIQDALEGITYQADQQIISIRSVKRYGECDSVTVTLQDWSE